MKDFHLLTTAWRFLQPLLFGQVRTNKRAITAHYDIDPEFFLSFLDPKTPCYTQGVYERDDETLDVATLRIPHGVIKPPSFARRIRFLP